MISTWATLVACLTLVSAISNTAPASDVQRVVSHLQGLMPLHTAAVSERFKRQAQNASGTSDDQPPLPPPPPPPPPPHMRLKYNKCCKKMPKIINMKSVKECFKSLRPVPPPPGNPGGPPPPTGSPSGPPPPPPPGGALPPPGAEGDDEEFGENDAGEAVETLDAITQNSPTSGQLQHRPGSKACKGGRPGAHREHMACAMECAFQKENLTKDGAVDQKAFAAYVDKYVQEKNATVWKDAIDAALKNCSVSVPAAIKREQNCTSGSLEMFQCMSRHIFVNCPESNWKAGDEKCDACRAAPQDCWAKKGQRKWLQQLPRNETQGVQA